MTTAFAQLAQQERRAYAQGSRPPVVWSAPGQGREARKVGDNARAISFRTTQGHSVESEALMAAVRELASSIERLQGHLQGVDGARYNHVPLKTAFSVNATFKFVGKMPPRQLPEVE